MSSNDDTQAHLSASLRKFVLTTRSPCIYMGLRWLCMVMKPKASNARQPSPLSEAIAATIRAERAAANLTKDDVLKRAGISRQTYYKLESGERVLDVSQFDAICKAIGVSMALILERAQQRLDTPPAAANHTGVR